MARKKSGWDDHSNGWNKPRNDFEAVVLALKLAIIAPNEEDARECKEMAQDLARRIHPEDVSLAKQIAARNPEDLTVLTDLEPI